MDVPGQRGGNITMCTAISENGVVTHIPSLGPYNTQKLLVFLDRLHSDLIPLHEGGLVGPHLPTFVIVWDNVSFHRGPLIRALFTASSKNADGALITLLPIPQSYRGVFFFAWRWRVYEHRALNQRSLLQAMDAACVDVTADQCKGWLWHVRRFFPRCIASENIRCDVDENLWPDRHEREDEQESEDEN